jgi:general secretion pathway protein D
MRRNYVFVFALLFGLLLAGCPKNSNTELSQGNKAELMQDYDAALMHFDRALKADPKNTEIRLKDQRVHFEAAQYHYQQGLKYKQQGNLQMALAEFQKSLSIDPSSPIAAAEAKKTMELLGAQMPQASAPEPSEPELLSGPPKLQPLSHVAIDLKMNSNDKTAYQTIGKIAGISVVFDPALQPKPLTVELPNVTLEEALDIVALQSKTFWEPVASNVILVSDDNPTNRRAYEDEICKTFYLSNVTTEADLNDIVTALRNTLGAAGVTAHLAPIKSLNAIVMRDTPDRVLLADRIIHAIDKAKPEVVIQVQFLEARRDLVRDLGVNPGTSASITFSPPASTTSSTSTTSTTTTTMPTLGLNQLKTLSSADFVVQLPSATVTALLTDSTTKVLENPEIRSVDGDRAQLKIGTRVPIATGSFQAGTGVGVSTAGTSLVNPLVNTQFQYQDVGVNVDLTPRIHPDRDISMHIRLEVSSVSGTESIGGINQPIISQKVIEHDVRLKDGEVNIEGNFIERQDTQSLSGWPGLARIPILHYFFAQTDVEHEDDEVLMVLIPHVVRVPVFTAADLQSIETGPDANVQLRPSITPTAPAAAAPIAQPSASAASPSSGGAAAPNTSMIASGQPALRFEPSNVTIKPGETSTIGVVVENVKDLYSIPMLLQYNPAVISVEEIRHGGFLSGGTQDEAIVQRIDPAHGQAVISAARTSGSGMSGTGTLVGIVVKGLAPGDSKLSIVQVRALDSQQKPMQLVTAEGNVHVQQ